MESGKILEEHGPGDSVVTIFRKHNATVIDVQEPVRKWLKK
jgi:hypothetical protein